ncbi:hypothetical protein, partial [Nocardioides salarius]|uniref:hypothetical protein n=1 Tax=Nocardioides salarius TaxID=374513 RepID=UPI0030FA3145
STDVHVSEWAAEVAFSQHLANHDRVLDGIIGGTSAMGIVVEGTDEAGEPFTLDASDLFVDDQDITWAAAWDIGDLVWALSRIPEASVDSVDLDSVVTDATDTLRVAGLEQRRGGEWTKVSNRRQGVVAQAGKVLRLRAVLRAEDDSLSYVPFRTRIADKARSGYLSVMGGSSAWTNLYRAKSVAKVVEAVESSPRNDEVLFELRLRRNGGRLEQTAGPQSTVVQGSKGFFVRVAGGRRG